MNPLYEAPVRISYYDLDGMGRLKFSALLRLAHIAADVNATALGVGYTDLAPLDMSFVLQRFGAAAARLPAYGEAVTLRTWPAAVERGTFIRKGDMYGARGEKIMEWASLWLLFDIKERKILRPAALPAELTGLGDQGAAITPEKIEVPQLLMESIRSYAAHTHTVRYADMDTNAHMNNAVYGDVIGNAAFDRTGTFAGGGDAPWTQLQINYLAETRLGDKIEVTAFRDGDDVFVVGESAARRAFTARVGFGKPQGFI